MFRFAVLSVLVLALLPTPGVPQTYGDVRLAGKPLIGHYSEGYGRLEVFLDDGWGTVCGPINRDIADTACRQLGYHSSLSSGSVETLKVTKANESTPIVLSVDKCSQIDEPQHILRCLYSTNVSGCSHKTDAALQCGSDGHDTTFYDTQVRLSNGAWPSSGVLEIFIKPKRSWGTVCASDFNAYAADSSCRQLGYTNAISYSGVDNSPEKTIWLSEAKCNKSQFCLNDCFTKYPSSPVSQCSGDGTVVFLDCTFDTYYAYLYHSGGELFCTYIHVPSDSTLIGIWTAVGIGALCIVGILIAVAVAVVVGVVKRKSKRTRYVQVDSDGDAIN